MRQLCLSVILESSNKDFVWAISNVYRPHSHRFGDRQLTWQPPKDFGAQFGGAWIVIRDFYITMLDNMK